MLGKWLEHDSVLEVISAWPTPADLRKAGRARIDVKLKSKGAKRHAVWAQTITGALDKQTVVVAGTDAAGVVLPHLAHQLAALHAQRNDVATQAEAHPLLPGPHHPCPGWGSGPPPSYLPKPSGAPSTPEPTWPPTSGLTPVTRRSGTSIRGEYVSHAGNKRLKRAMFGSAFALLRSDPVSRAYYERKIAQGKAPWAKPSSPWPTAASSPCTP